jgi:hypothetical protein
VTFVNFCFRYTKEQGADGISVATVLNLLGAVYIRTNDLKQAGTYPFQLPLCRKVPFGSFRAVCALAFGLLTTQPSCVTWNPFPISLSLKF